MMNLKVKIRDKGKVVVYEKLEDVPAEFDHLIACKYDIPPEPHTEEEHEQIEQYHNIFKELIGRQRSARSN